MPPARFVPDRCGETCAWARVPSLRPARRPLGSGPPLPGRCRGAGAGRRRARRRARCRDRRVWRCAGWEMGGCGRPHGHGCAGGIGVAAQPAMFRVLRAACCGVSYGD